MEPDVIKSLYYMYKRQIIQFYKLNKDGSGFSDSFVYAIAHDCYPYFHARYCYLDNRFNDIKFWEKIKSLAPVEAQGLNTPFESDWEI